MHRFPSRRDFTALAAGLALCCSAFSQAHDGASYPTQPIRMVVGFPAGGPTDVAARLIADSLSRSLGQPVVVDNKPGANATLAAELVARAKPRWLHHPHGGYKPPHQCIAVQEPQVR